MAQSFAQAVARGQQVNGYFLYRFRFTHAVFCLTIAAMAEQNGWRRSLREARRALKLDQQALADRVGVSRETIRGYENGRRNPTRHNLDAIFQELKLPTDQCNTIREALGFAPLRSLYTALFDRGYFLSADQLPSHLAQQPWPEFVVNDPMEVVAANAACEAIWDVDFEWEKAHRSRAALNLLAVASDHHFADRVLNWDDVVFVMAGVVKGQSMTIEEQHPYLAEVLAEFASGDPVFLQRLLAAYERAEPMAPIVRWSYPVVWNVEPHGTMRFHAMVTTASEPDAFSVNSWIPTDAESWRVLECVKAEHAARLAARR